MNQRQLYEQYTDNLLDSVFQNARYSEPNMFGNQWQQPSGLHSVPVHSKSPSIEEQPQSPIIARKSVQSPTPKKMSVVRKQVPSSPSPSQEAATTKTRKKKRIIKKIIYEASETDDDDDDDESGQEEQVERRRSRNQQDKHNLQNISHTNNTIQADPKPLVARKSLRDTLIRRKKPATPRAQDVLQDDSYTQQQPRVFVDDTPSFWRPRESRKKGWWKGNRAPSNTNDEEKPTQSGSISKKDKKVVSSIKSRRAARPMAFKTPKRKNKVSGSNSTSTAQNNYVASTSYQAASTPVMTAPQTPVMAAPQTPVMYAMPQMYPQQTLFPQQMMQQFAQPLPFGHPSPMYYHPQPAEATTAEEDTKIKRRTTIYNPREASHDKCCIM